MAEAKTRRITKKDWDSVEKFVQSQYDERKKSKFRTSNEERWKEVDRQIAMEEMQRLDEHGKARKADWHNTLELGELSKASEVIASDVMRIMFPPSWFQPHVELEGRVDPQTGKTVIDGERQKVTDGLLKSMMSQQHSDFGFRARVRLSIKEALHHGSFVAEAQWNRQLMVKDGGKVKQVGAPVWVPYSMWNAYPDPSPSVTGTDMFYTGSMILVEYMPKHRVEQMAQGEGWMADRLEKVNETTHKNGKVETKDYELIKYYGDIVIERGDGDIYLPNSKVILANGKLIYYSDNELPYPPVIYGGYERQDVRDPYWTSCIIKMSPMQKFCSIMANKFADAVALKVEPPVEYDGNDPDYVTNDGPMIAPGAKSSTKSMGNGMKVLDIGQPNFALEAMEFGMRHMQEGTGVSAVRSGTTNSDRQTATEVNKIAQGAEVRTIEFIANLEPCLRTFLYMQHELNQRHLDDYEFYNDEMHTPDYIRVKSKDIKGNATFEIVGSKGVLGEEQRTQRTTNVTAFASQNPLFAPLLKPEQVLVDMYRDAGKKNPEDWVKVGAGGQPDAAGQAQAAHMQQQMQEAQQQLQKQTQQAQQQLQQKEKELASVEEKLKKQGNDQILREQKVKYEEQILAIKKQVDGYMSQDQSEGIKRHGEIMKSGSEILQRADVVTPVLEGLAKIVKESQQNTEQALEALAKIQSDNTKILSAMVTAQTKPKKISVQKDGSGRISGAIVTQ
jgi:hypothetical protein